MYYNTRGGVVVQGLDQREGDFLIILIAPNTQVVVMFDHHQFLRGLYVSLVPDQFREKHPAVLVQCSQMTVHYKSVPFYFGHWISDLLPGSQGKDPDYLMASTLDL